MLKTIDLTPHTGSEIVADRQDLLDGVHSREILETLHKRGMLLFRRLNFTQEEQLKFTGTLGAVFQPPKSSGQTSALTISLDEKVMREAAYFEGSFLWHFDGSNQPSLPAASLLGAKVLSEVGGQTEFASTSAAYEDLPEERKQALEGVLVRHSLCSPYRLEKLQPSEGVIAFWTNSNPVPQGFPLVWNHPSGRKSLMVGSTAFHIESDDLDDSLLGELLEWVTQPRYVYRHEWEVGDLLIWDNFGVLHRALPYARDSGRAMTRTMLSRMGEFA